MNADNINPLTGDIIKAHSEPIKELLRPQMIRITQSLKDEVKSSADKHNEGNFNRELRDLIQIGLKNRKGKAKNNTVLPVVSESYCTICNKKVEYHNFGLCEDCRR